MTSVAPTDTRTTREPRKGATAATSTPGADTMVGAGAVVVVDGIELSAVEVEVRSVSPDDSARPDPGEADRATLPTATADTGPVLALLPCARVGWDTACVSGAIAAGMCSNQCN